MRPHSRRAAILALTALVASSSPLDAHSLLRSQGQAVIESDRLVVTLDVSPEDFNHLYGLIPSADGTVGMDSVLAAARNHADDLTTGLQIWDERGEPLAGEPFELSTQSPTSPRLPWMQLRAMRLRYTARFRLPTHRRFLTFRMNVVETGPALARQWVILFRSADDAIPQVLQLTSRGNAETIELDWSSDRPRLRALPSVPGQDPACAPMQERGAARFQEIFVDLDVTFEMLRVRTTIPLPLLNTWIPVRRRTEGRLEPDEQAELLVAARELASTAIEVRGGGGTSKSNLFEIDVLSADAGTNEPSRPPGPIGFFSGRLEIHQQFETPNSVEPSTLVWSLLNNAVMSARVAIRADGQCTSRVFSSYAPTIER